MTVCIVREGERGESSNILGVFAQHADAVTCVLTFCGGKAPYRRQREREVGHVVSFWSCDDIDEVWIERWEVQS